MAEVTKQIVEHDGHTLTFSEKSHRYTLDGQAVKSVTYYTGQANKPLLINWAVKCAVECFMQNLKAGDYIDAFVYEALPKMMKAEHNKRMKEAGQFGTDVHLVVENAVVNHRAIEAQSTVEFHAKSVLKWLEANTNGVIYAEKLLFSIEDWYTGKLDLYVETKKGTNAIADLKSGSGIYPEYRLQLAAYLKGLIEMGLADEGDDRVIVHTSIGDADDLWIGYDKFASDYAAFKGLLTYGKWVKEYE